MSLVLSCNFFIGIFGPNSIIKTADFFLENKYDNIYSFIYSNSLRNDFFKYFCRLKILLKKKKNSLLI